MELSFWIFNLLLSNYSVAETSISQTKCAEYRNTTVDSATAAPGKFPFMVTVYANNSNSVEYHSGILISDKFVLSAAPGLPESSKPVVVLKTKTIKRLKTYDVNETFVHPNFNGMSFNSTNFRLFRLNESVKFDDYVRPACLPLKDLSVSKNATQVGWKDRKIPTNDKLFKIDSNVISEESCKAMYVSAGANKIVNESKFVSDLENGTIFCATPEKDQLQMCNDQDYVDSALIDADSSASDTLIGFALYNLKCDNNSATVFVRVSAFIEWIESIVWREDTPPATTPKIAQDEAKPEIPGNGTSSSTTTSDDKATTPKIIPEIPGKGNITNSTTTTTETQDPVKKSNTVLYCLIPVILVPFVLYGIYLYLKRKQVEE